MKSMTMCMLQFSVIGHDIVSRGDSSTNYGHDVGLCGDLLTKNVKRTLTL